MSRNIKYLGSNCKPVIAETVESKQTNQLNSSKEIKMENVNTQAIEMEINAGTAVAPEQVAVVEEVVRTNVEKVINPAEEQTVEEKAMTVETQDKLKEAAEIATTVKARSVNWNAVVASGVIGAVSVGSRLLIENTQETEEENKHSALEIAGRTIAVAATAAGLSLATQKLVTKTATDDSYGLMATAIIANGLSVTDAIFGDSLVEMLNGAAGKVTDSVTEMFNKEEAAISEL